MVYTPARRSCRATGIAPDRQPQQIFRGGATYSRGGVAEVRGISRRYSHERVRRRLYGDEAVLERLIDALGKAGLPENYG